MRFSVRPRGSERFGPHVCVTGNMVRTLARLGYGTDDRVVKAMDWLVGIQLDDGGWNCFTEDGGKHGSFKSIQPLWALSEMNRLNLDRTGLRVRGRAASFSSDIGYTSLMLMSQLSRWIF